MWFDMEPMDVASLDASPFRIENEAIANAPPERVFDVFVSGERQTEWFPDFVACRWTTPAPHGVGATRDIEMKTLTVKERFLIWERGRRVTFSMFGITVPLVKAMAEDVHFEALGDGRTRIVWRVHYSPRLLMRAVHPIARAIFGKMFAGATRGLARYATQNPG
jgi:uncharacterized protein YndB with AHSA1/START domain